MLDLSIAMLVITRGLLTNFQHQLPKCARLRLIGQSQKLSERKWLDLGSKNARTCVNRDCVVRRVFWFFECIYFWRFPKNRLSSGKRLHIYGKSQSSIRKSTINGPCSIAFCLFTRGYPQIIHVIFGFSLNHPAIKGQTPIVGYLHISAYSFYTMMNQTRFKGPSLLFISPK